MVFNDLTSENYVLYTMKHYDNPQCSTHEEFIDDLKHIKYLKRLLIKYRTTGTLRERLMLNHLILIYNVFGQHAATRLLFFRIEKADHSALKTFLVYLQRMPDILEKFNGESIYSSDITIDMKVAQALRSIG